jgi:hypothetical protein
MVPVVLLACGLALLAGGCLAWAGAAWARPEAGWRAPANQLPVAAAPVGLLAADQLPPAGLRAGR